ncbi:MAG: hypothetical protein Q8865_01195 [Bacillota bacterium]|nr:hypothetical protein [Bacillota bacterium]
MCKKSNCLLTAIFSIVVGIVIAALFAYNRIPHISVSCLIALALAAITLIILSVLSSAAGRSAALAKCVCFQGRCLLLSTIGTIVSTLIALSISLNHAHFLAAVLIFFVFTFLTMMLTTLTALLHCAIGRLCHIKCDE